MRTEKRQWIRNNTDKDGKNSCNRKVPERDRKRAACVHREELHRGQNKELTQECHYPMGAKKHSSVQNSPRSATIPWGPRSTPQSRTPPGVPQPHGGQEALLSPEQRTPPGVPQPHGGQEPILSPELPQECHNPMGAKKHSSVQNKELSQECHNPMGAKKHSSVQSKELLQECPNPMRAKNPSSVQNSPRSATTPWGPESPPQSRPKNSSRNATTIKWAKKHSSVQNSPRSAITPWGPRSPPPSRTPPGVPQPHGGQEALLCPRQGVWCGAESSGHTDPVDSLLVHDGGSSGGLSITGTRDTVTAGNRPR
ncbi:hypothetical protein ACOMHN_057850 [Nucella lapillus]